MKHSLILISFLLFSNSVFGQSIQEQQEVIGRCKHKSTIQGITNFKISLTHEITVSPDGCLIVKGSKIIPTKIGKRMVQITVHPGFCSRDEGWDDCTTDRSRVEFYDGKGVKSLLAHQ